MASVRVAALLWRRVNQATYDTLADQSRGQYHIALNNSGQIGHFFEGLNPQNFTDKGGYDLVVPLQPLDGPNPIPARELKVRFMGAEAARHDWNIPSQRSATAYDLWRLSRRGNPAPSDVVGKDNILLVRDDRGGYHARWLSASDLNKIPDSLREEIESRDVGVKEFSAPTSFVEEIVASLRSTLNVLLYGPPATGKTHIVNQIIDIFGGVRLRLDAENDALRPAKDNFRFAFLTFHQSYTYEEFMISLMPAEGDSNALLSLRPRLGTLLELAKFAHEDENEALIVIDEINRGNVSRIFGEFITLMEADKRRDEDGGILPTTIEIKLPHLERPIALPRRLYVLATMNSVDKSVAPLDAALRRRFKIVELSPRLDSIAEECAITNWHSPILAMPSDANDYRVLALQVVAKLNQRIEIYRGSEYMLGQWYLAAMCDNRLDTDGARTALHEAWWSRILPQIEELFSEQVEQIARILELRAEQSDAVSIVRPEPDDVEFGALPALRKNRDRAALDAFLLRFVALSADEPEA